MPTTSQRQSAGESTTATSGNQALAASDVAALVGKYGRQPTKCAHRLLEEGYYYAACSDAHRASDAESTATRDCELEAISR